VSSQKAMVERYTDGFRRGVVLNGDAVDVVYSEVFTFAAGLVSRLDTFHVWLGELPKG
jgi:hypothetical protein